MIKRHLTGVTLLKSSLLNSHNSKIVFCLVDLQKMSISMFMHNLGFHFQCSWNKTKNSFGIVFMFWLEWNTTQCQYIIDVTMLRSVFLVIELLQVGDHFLNYESTNTEWKNDMIDERNLSPDFQKLRSSCHRMHEKLSRQTKVLNNNQSITLSL